MKKRMFYKKDYVKELLKIIRTETDTTKLPKLLSDYHEKDIAEAITLLSENERKQLYPVLGAQKVAEIFLIWMIPKNILKNCRLKRLPKWFLTWMPMMHWTFWMI